MLEKVKAWTHGLVQKLLAFEFTTDTASSELFDTVLEAPAGCRQRHPGRSEVRAGDVAHARRHVSVPLGPATRAGWTRSARSERRCRTSPERSGSVKGER